MFLVTLETENELEFLDAIGISFEHDGDFTIACQDGSFRKGKTSEIKSLLAHEIGEAE